MSSSATLRLKYAAIGAIVVPIFGRLALTGTGHSGDWYRYLVPVVVGSIAGYLLGLMRSRVLSEHSELEKTVEELQEQIASTEHMSSVLSEREGYLQGILDHAQPIMYLKDVDGRYLTVNRQYEKAAHITLEMIKDKFDHDIFPEEVASLFVEQDRQVFHTRQDFEFEETIPLPDGVRTFITSKFPLFDKQGEIWAVGGVCTDITERKKAEELLRSEKERSTVTLRSIGDGVMTTDTSGRVVLINAMGERITGWKQADAEGRPALEVLPLVGMDDVTPAESPLTTVLGKGEIFIRSGHVHLFSGEGSRLCISDSGAPIRNSENEVVGVVWVFRDITDQVKSEKEAAKVSKLEAVGVLAGGIAHDFNNLLVAIMGNIDLSLQFLPSDHDAVDLLKSAEQASVRARELTGQLLTFSAGGDPIKEIASLGDVIKTSTNFVLRGTNVACDFMIPDDLWLVDVDKGQLSQVIQNLVLNSKTAMPDGGRIVISAENVSQMPAEMLLKPVGHGYVRISVTDRGVGISEDIIDRIFDPYFSSTADGSGLELAIAHSIIKKHNGHLSVESQPGEGACFTISLPAAEKQALQVPRADQEAAEESGSIILMDDDLMVQRTASDMLTRLGFEVVITNDGEQALEVYDRMKGEGATPVPRARGPACS
jgi:PAS domain S-box-containing protein